LGLIELISEIAKLISLSFRLFGNILIGGILLMLLSSVAHYFLPLPILFFEFFVAILQATLFAVLTLFYVKMAISEPH
jgi:F-type H+-transporting ATPase subunit a